jgi:hypothetical protein
MRRWFAAALIALAAPAGAADRASAPAHGYETGKLTIAGEAFAPADVVDARAIPDINKKVGLMLTLSPAAAARLARISEGLIGKPLLVALDGKSLGGEMVRKPLSGGVVEIPGRWSLSDAEALARRISGKDPLPDDLGGE